MDKLQFLVQIIFWLINFKGEEPQCKYPELANLCSQKRIIPFDRIHDSQANYHSTVNIFITLQMKEGQGPTATLLQDSQHMRTMPHHPCLENAQEGARLG